MDDTKPPLSNPPTICVALPCYNEGVAIYDVVQSFRRALPAARVVVLDNNSRDNTVTEAQRAGADVRQVPRQGKGNVVRRLFADVDADIYVMADGDGTYDSNAAASLIRYLVEHDLDMVVGRRRSVEADTYRNGHVLGNWLLTRSVSVLFGRSFDDMLSGFRVFSRRFAKSFPAASSGFEIETELTVHALRMRLPTAEIETNYFARPEGSHSKLNTYRDGVRILWMIFKLFESERPLAFFSIFAALSALASTLLSIPLWTTFFETGLVPRLPTAVLCAALAIIAVIALVCGILLDAVTHSRREARYSLYLSQPRPPWTSLSAWPTEVEAAPVLVPSKAARPLPQSISNALIVWQSVTTERAMHAWILIAFGIIAAVLMGQDFNWDLQNYHRYNAWAFLYGRLGVDLAPAMLQSYFNPLLDLPYYWLTETLRWNARWVAFVFGAVQGICACALLVIAGRVLPWARDRRGMAAIAAFTGCAASSFLMELGTTMGDATTAAFILTALTIVLTRFDRTCDIRWQWAALAGMLTGIACGLKLTSAPYAIALFVAAAALPAGSSRVQATRAVTLAATMAVGLVLAGGAWHARMWAEFGNPLFPQFNHWFGAPLAASIGYGDPHLWQPQSIWEALVFPFLVIGDSLRISEVEVRPFLWPTVSLIAFAAIVAKLTRHLRAPIDDDMGRSQRAILIFVGVSYIVWMYVFGIYRYTVAFEVLLPIVAWILLGRLNLPPAARIALPVVIFIVAVLTPFGSMMQERVEFGRKAFRVNPPAIADASRTTLLLVGDQPNAWVLPAFPVEIAAIGLDNSFPESPAYRRRAQQIMNERGGPVLALVRDASPGGIEGTMNVAKGLSKYGLSLDQSSCTPFRAKAGQRDIGFRLCAVTGRFILGTN
jgi:glycosyltransferase involved in cell wall biosynthesis